MTVASPTQIRLARAQLGTALSLFIREKDPISVQALACGGCEMIEKAAIRSNISPISTHLIPNNSNLDLKKLREERNVYWNAIKHFLGSNSRDPNRDDEKIMADFTDRANDAVLFLGWWDYLAVTRKLPIEAQVFQVWWYALNERALAPGVDLDIIRGLFPKIIDQTRREQKRRLNRAIEKYRKDKAILAEPGTELGPLMPANGDA